MNFTSLVLHGLSAVAVYSDVIGVRALFVTLSLVAASVLAGGTAVVIRLTTNFAIPGWATYAVGLSAILLVQAVTLSVLFVFLVLFNRTTLGTMPIQAYQHLISSTSGPERGGHVVLMPRRVQP